MCGVFNKLIVSVEKHQVVVSFWTPTTTLYCCVLLFVKTGGSKAIIVLVVVVTLWHSHYSVPLLALGVDQVAKLNSAKHPLTKFIKLVHLDEATQIS
jgi:hypothetical protein